MTGGEELVLAEVIDAVPAGLELGDDGANTMGPGLGSTVGE